MKRRKINMLTLNNEEIRYEPDIDLLRLVESYNELKSHLEYFQRYNIYKLEDNEDYYSEELLKFISKLDIIIKDYCKSLEEGNRKDIKSLQDIVIKILKNKIDSCKEYFELHKDELIDLGYGDILEDEVSLL